MMAMTTRSSIRVKARLWRSGIGNPLSAEGDASNRQSNRTNAVVFQVDGNLGLERPQLLNRRDTLVAESLSGRNHDLVGVLRTEAHAHPSPLGQPDNSTRSICGV